MPLRSMANALDIRSHTWLHFPRYFNRFRLRGSDCTGALCTGPSYREIAFVALLDKYLLLASHDVVLVDMSGMLPRCLLDDADHLSADREIVFRVKIDRIVVKR